MDSRDQMQSYPYDELISKPSLHSGENPKSFSSVTRKNSFTAWTDTVWGLVVHGILSVGVVIFVIFLVDNHPFNVDQRRASVQTVGGNTTLPFALLQSDIVTILSGMITIQKWALAAWVVPLCWRIAMLLMEISGLRHQELKVLVKYRLLKPDTYLGSSPAFIMGTLLLASLAANLSSPILTGSITWAPKNQPVQRGLPALFVGFSETKAESLMSIPSEYLDDARGRYYIAMRAVGLVNTAWGKGIDKHILKRVLGSLEAFAIGSFIKSVTLPYFAVDSIRWVEYENDLPTYAKNKMNPDEPLDEALKLSPSGLPIYPVGYAALIPDLNNPTNWSSDPLESRTIEETRLLVFMLGADGNLTCALPPTTYIREDPFYPQNYYAYAWVTFRAGAGTCNGYRCVVSSASTVSTLQGDTLPDLEPHVLTFQALSMALVVSGTLVNLNSSIPPSWDNVDDYVEAILVRSYSGAWNTMNDAVGNSISQSNYRPSLLILLAQVHRGRVYGWFGLQLSVTILGIIFIILQSGLSKFPLIGDTALTAFYLDTTGVPREGELDLFKNGTLRIEQDGDRLTIVDMRGNVEERMY